MTESREAEKIKVGTRRMIQAWQQGLEWYQPTFRGHELHEEGGVTRISLDNLKILVEPLGRAMRVSVGPGQGILVEWNGGMCYLATGFSIGYRGEGPTGLATFLTSQDFGDMGDFRNVVAGLDENFRGTLVPHPDGE